MLGVPCCPKAATGTTTSKHARQHAMKQLGYQNIYLTLKQDLPLTAAGT
jgi:hypothetical protein